MNNAPAKVSGTRSLAETHTEGFEFLKPTSPGAGRGCLLQIYPATVHAGIIRLLRRRTLIGRDLSCEVALEDTAVSRIHAAVDLDDHAYVLMDLGSRNGTYVDDQLLTDRKKLVGGELIRLGSTILKFMASMDQEAQYHAVVHELMTRDPLTSAFNRSFLISTLEKLLPQCLRSGAEFSVILIDIDHFKAVNDNHGHLVGDEVLRLFCERIRSVLRPHDILCRMGGEEFVVVSEKTGLHDAVRVAERLRLNVASLPFATQAGPLLITCSLGVAVSNHSRPVESVDELLNVADQRLYSAKRSGRNCVQSAIDAETRA